MSTPEWIIVSGLAMSAIALTGGLTLALSERTQRRLVLPLVAFAAGALLGGALFHKLPQRDRWSDAPLTVYLWFSAGFVTFHLTAAVTIEATLLVPFAAGIAVQLTAA